MFYINGLILFFFCTFTTKPDRLPHRFCDFTARFSSRPHTHFPVIEVAQRMMSLQNPQFHSVTTTRTAHHRRYGFRVRFPYETAARRYDFIKRQWPFPIPVGKPVGLVWLLWDMANKHRGKDYSGINMHQLEPRHRLYLLVKPQTIGKASKILIWLNSWFTQVYFETVKRQHDLKWKQVKRSQQPHDCNFEYIYKFCYLGKNHVALPIKKIQDWVVGEHPHLQ